MKGWAELKDAFWAVLDGEPGERERQLAVLASIDPALPGQLEALLAADSRGDPLPLLLKTESPGPSRPDRIGRYDVIGVLGAGAMGDVYRAVDPQLRREVAIKVLPPVLTSNSDRLARFQREAQVLASLNHRHIAQVYGLEETSGTPALVMELVEGPTLAQLIADSAAPITTHRAVTIGKQIADGLGAAHDKGIVHRDLKPANVALSLEGEVKILDFGLSKVLEMDRPRPMAPNATSAGVVLGTPAYMSPEQARGLPVDRRTDIWSFGCVLFELLTARQPFGGLTPSDCLAAVLERAPDMSLLPDTTPAAVRRLLHHCLQKDPKQRLRDIADAQLLLEDAIAGPDAERGPVVHAVPAERRGRLNVPAAWWAVSLALAAAVALLTTRPLLSDRAPEQLTRTVASIVLPRGIHLSMGNLQSVSSEVRFAVSPDGRHLVFVAGDESRVSRLWLRDLASAAFQPLPGTEGAGFPFWSADSTAVGFVAAGKLRALRLAGGTPMTVAGTGFRAGAWNRQNLILFPPAPGSPLSVTPVSGGAVSIATRLDTDSGEVQHEYPAFLPDGRRFVFFGLGSRVSALAPRGVYIASLDDPGTATLLVPGAAQPQYANGHLLFVQNGTLLAQRFDEQRGALEGASVPLVEDVILSTVGATGGTAAYSASGSTLVYQAALRTESRPVWFDRTGRQLTAITAGGDYGDVALSPDGRRVVVSVRDPARQTHDLWLYDADGTRGQRLTFDAADEFAPVWSPDSTRLLFSAASGGTVNLLVKNMTGVGDAATLDVDQRGLGRYAADWSRDGRQILYIGGGRAIGKSDVWTALLAGDSNAQPLLESGFVETQPRFSPDSRWFVYTSDETGRFEVYADRFPQRGAKRRLSSDGGGWPRWSRDGREIYFLTQDNHLMSAAVRTDAAGLHAEEPKQLFAMRPRAMGRLDAYPYDVSADGKRIVVNTLVEDESSDTITLVLNWSSLGR